MSILLFGSWRFAPMKSQRRECAPGSGNLKVGGGKFAAFGHHLVADFLPFVQGGQPGALHGSDMDEYVITAIRRLDETKTLLGIEKFHGTLWHSAPPLRKRHPAWLGCASRSLASEFNVVLGKALKGQQGQAKPRTRPK
jgi:hypothetical protein